MQNLKLSSAANYRWRFIGHVSPAAVVKDFTNEYLMKAFDDNDDLFITIYDNEHNKLLSKAQGLRSESFT